jgi:hypothetical protein
MRHHASISRCAIVTRSCLIHPRSALCAENGSQDPTSTYLDPRRSANIQIVLAAVSVAAVPARSLQTQPSSVRQASDIALSSEVARQSHSKKALCFHHPPGRSLSLECCRVLNARLLTWADRHIMGLLSSKVCALIACIFDRRVRLLPCKCIRLYSCQSGDFLSHFNDVARSGRNVLRNYPACSQHNARLPVRWGKIASVRQYCTFIQYHGFVWSLKRSSMTQQRAASTDYTAVPSDFPHEPGVTHWNRCVTWNICEELALHLASECAQVQLESDRSVRPIDILFKSYSLVEALGWGEPPLLRWVTRRVAGLLNWPTPDIAK